MMSKLRSLAKLVIRKGYLHAVPDQPYLKILYWANMGKKLNLKNPTTYNEKLQWLKLHDRKPIYTTMVDKYEAKLLVGSIIGEEYLIPTLGIWKHPEEIDFDTLPNKFVLKTTHDSGGIQIIDKSQTINRENLNRFFNDRLKNSTYEIQREWPYKNVPPRIIAEAYMEDNKTKELRDYKFFCFDGTVKSMYIASDRQSERPTAFDFFDPDFNWLDIRHGHPNAENRPEKPENFELMKKIAEKLSKGICHLRVDLYEINGRVYFGELTFFHHGGIVRFDPDEWDYIFGSWLKLPEIS